MQSLKTLEFSLDKQVAIIKLNRPDAANGINLTLAKELKVCAEQCSENNNIRAVLLTGNGKMFSAGGDLKSFAAEGEAMAPMISELISYMHDAIRLFDEMQKPLIIAINGTAAGAGFSIACIGDLVFAADTAKFTMAYSAAGLTPDAGGSYYLPRLVGLRKAQELILTNPILSANEALELGIITEVVKSEVLYETALEHAQRLATGPTYAFGNIKHLISKSSNNTLEEQLALEKTTMLNSIESVDGNEGIVAFLEKRKPAFIGQ